MVAQTSERNEEAEAFTASQIAEHIFAKPSVVAHAEELAKRAEGPGIQQSRLLTIEAVERAARLTIDTRELWNTLPELNDRKIVTQTWNNFAKKIGLGETVPEEATSTGGRHNMDMMAQELADSYDTLNATRSAENIVDLDRVNPRLQGYFAEQLSVLMQQSIEALGRAQDQGKDKSIEITKCAREIEDIAAYILAEQMLQATVEKEMEAKYEDFRTAKETPQRPQGTRIPDTTFADLFRGNTHRTGPNTPFGF